MADENMALNKGAGEDASQTSTPDVEPKATEEVVEAEVKTEESSEVKTEAEATETGDSTLKPPPKKGAQQRIRELDRRVKEKEAINKSLAEKLAEVTSQLGTTAQPAPSYTPPAVEEPLIKPGEEIDAVELERRMQLRDQRILAKAQAHNVFLNQVNRAIDNINKEAREAMDTYPQLNPKHESFNRELSSSVTEASEAFVKANPGGSLRKFIDNLMKPYQRAVTKEVGEVRENLAKQVSQQAMRPTSVPKGEKTADKMTIKELEDKLGIVN